MKALWKLAIGFIITLSLAACAGFGTQRGQVPSHVPDWPSQTNETGPKGPTSQR